MYRKSQVKEPDPLNVFGLAQLMRQRNVLMIPRTRKYYPRLGKFSIQTQLCPMKHIRLPAV